MANAHALPAPAVLPAEHLGHLLQILHASGRALIGPTVQGNAIVFAEIRGVDDLPQGWTAKQAPGKYRLRRRGDLAYFGFASTAQSLRPFFHVPLQRLWKARRENGRFTVVQEPPARRPLAAIGLRSCDLSALLNQDRILQGGPYADPHYAARRADLFVVVVQCTEAGGTCFCDSMGTGPRAEKGFDLALTEILQGGHRFLIECGSEAGAAVLEQLGCAPAGEAEFLAAREGCERARADMGRRLDTSGIRDLLLRNLEHPRWDEVASRCLSCTNCTLACPTCFCTSIEDTSDLARATAERIRRWDSCFTLSHSHLHGGPVRATVKGRYRQWMTHKLATWHDQFGLSGCVGCGRCITWCPVGIDITEEAAAIRATDGARAAAGGSAA